MKNEILGKVAIKLMSSVRKESVRETLGLFFNTDNIQDYKSIIYDSTLLGFSDNATVNLLDESIKEHYSEDEILYIRKAFLDRYTRIIEEYLSFTSKLKGLYDFSTVSPEEYEDIMIDEIVNYVLIEDKNFFDSIIRMKASINFEIKKKNNFNINTRKMEKEALDQKIIAMQKDVTLTSQQCSQFFLGLETSTKGLVKLTGSGSGKSFTFYGSDITSVSPCFLHEQRNDLEVFADIFRLFSGESSPERKIYTAITIGGKYNVRVFVKSVFDEAYRKLQRAIEISNSVSEKKFGRFS